MSDCLLELSLGIQLDRLLYCYVLPLAHCTEQPQVLALSRRWPTVVLLSPCSTNQYYGGVFEYNIKSGGTARLCHVWEGWLRGGWGCRSNEGWASPMIDVNFVMHMCVYRPHLCEIHDLWFYLVVAHGTSGPQTALARGHCASNWYETLRASLVARGNGCAKPYTRP
jgi:hypothetical protein